jgi:hypothetical protein
MIASTVNIAISPAEIRLCARNNMIVVFLPAWEIHSGTGLGSVILFSLMALVFLLPGFILIILCQLPAPRII